MWPLQGGSVFTDMEKMVITVNEKCRSQTHPYTEKERFLKCIYRLTGVRFLAECRANDFPPGDGCRVSELGFFPCYF